MCRTTFNKLNTRTLRQTLGQYPTGVAIVTTTGDDGQAVGMTINSFCSVSMNPPLVAWCVDRDAGGYGAFERCGGYTISILASDQEELARRFATAGADKFQQADSLEHAADTGCGLAIAGACAWLQCSVYRRLIAGDHLMLIGEVRAFNKSAGEPLVFAQGSFTGIAAHKQFKNGLTRAA